MNENNSKAKHNGMVIVLLRMQAYTNEQRALRKAKAMIFCLALICHFALLSCAVCDLIW